MREEEDDGDNDVERKDEAEDAALANTGETERVDVRVLGRRMRPRR